MSEELHLGISPKAHEKLLSFLSASGLGLLSVWIFPATDTEFPLYDSLVNYFPFSVLGKVFSEVVPEMVINQIQLLIVAN